MKSIVGRTLIACLLALGGAQVYAVELKSTDIGFRSGGSYPIGQLNRFGPSYHISTFIAWNAEHHGFGMDFSADTQHVAKNQSHSRIGLVGNENFDSTINMWHIGPWVRADLALGPLHLMPLAGLGAYQLNTFQRCENRLAGDCGDQHSLHYINTSNYLGFNAGLQIGLHLGRVMIGAEARLHQMLGGGYHRNPTLFTPTVFVVLRSKT